MARDPREEKRRGEQRASRKPHLGPREARALFEAVTDHRVKRWRFFDDALAPAMPAWSGFAREYARYRRFASAPPFAHGGDGPWEDLWTFHALSRVFEWLIIGIQDRAGLGRRYPNWPGEGDHPVPSRDELVRFFSAFGMAPMRVQPHYRFFFHQVAAAGSDPALQAPGVGCRVGERYGRRAVGRHGEAGEALQRHVRMSNAECLVVHVQSDAGFSQLSPSAGMKSNVNGRRLYSPRL